MYKINFDKVINRKNTNCSKWDNAKKRLNADIDLPLWVADMDFQSPPEVIKTLCKYAAHGIYGYTYIPDEYYKTIIEWNRKKHFWDIPQEHILFSPGVVISLKTLVQAFTKPGDNIIIQSPIYPPFYSSISSNERRILVNPLIIRDGRYHIDFNDFEKKIKDKKTTMFLLCSPHNPVGRVWNKEELTRMGKLCVKHNVFVVSDEMHSDLVYKPFKHIPFPTISKKNSMISAVCSAPGKTFNLAGLQTSNIIIANSVLRKRLKLFLYKRNGLVEPNQFGMAASIAAYKYGEPWLEQALNYIYENYLFLKSFFQKKLPEIRIFDLEATYLVWLDFNALNFSLETLRKVIFQKAKVGLNDGRTFGEKEGSGFYRINIACPRSILKKALIRIAAAVQSEKK